MAYRRRHGITRSSTFKEEIYRPPSNHNNNTTSSSSSSAPTSPLASNKTTRPSDAHRESPLSAGYINSTFQSSFQNRSKVGITRSSTFKEGIYRPPNDNTTSSSSAPTSPLASNKATRASDTHRESPLSSGYINSAFQSSFRDRSKEGGTSVDKRTQDMQGTFKLQNTTETNNEEFFMQNLWQEGRMQSATPQTVQEHQLKASRDVAIATAAKAKLLLREIKTVKSDLAFAKERSCQLEEENKILREARDKGDHPADDDMIRLQLETLLAEKARLAHENSVYIRENSCLREIIKYHKLGMQDVVYLDEIIEEVAEVNPSISRTLSAPLPSSPRSIQTKSPESINVPTLDNLRLEDSIKHDGTWAQV